MYRVKSGNWIWFWQELEDWNRLGPHPEEMTADTVLVKANPVRGVFRRDGYFCKLEMPACRNPVTFWRAVLFPRARREFYSALALDVAGIPVTPPVGYGQALTCSMLITREVPEAVTANAWFQKQFVRGGGDPEMFLRSWGEFLRKLLASGFYHPDFHGGNLLYQPESQSFILVDVYGVRRRRFFRGLGRRRMIMALREFREILNREQLLNGLQLCGAAKDRQEAEQWHDELLQYAAARTQRELSRRLKQFFSGYAKYGKTVEWGGRSLWLTLDAAGMPLVEPEKLDSETYEVLSGSDETLRDLRKRDFELALHLIPHPRIVAWEAATGRIYRERAGAAMSEEQGGYLRERLRIAGFEPKKFKLVSDRFGRPAVEEV